MDDVFLKLVNLSISASWLILAVLVLRVVLKKAPKWVMPLLWGVVALRLVCPFSIESVLSLIPSAETIPSEIVTETREPVLYEQATLDIVTNPTLPPAAEVTVGVSRQQAQVDFNIYSVLWLAGMAALLVHALVSAGKLKKKLATAILLRDNIYESEFVDSPFVFGVVKPNIYLPMHMDEGTAAHVIAHERAHLARRDHWWKVLGYLVLALHWFNPLVWVAYILFCRDIELACDERVVKGLDGAARADYSQALLSCAAPGRAVAACPLFCRDIELACDERVVKGLDGAARADYSQALLSCAAPGRAVAACPLAFGEGNIKTRVKSALHYKKPAFWVAAAAVLAVVIMAVCFLTNPKSERGSLVWAQKLNAADVASIELYVPAEGKARQYKKLDTEEMAQAVELINSSRGTYIEKPETVYGGLPVWFLLTMADGTVHAVGSVVGHYLIIDGDTFDADVENQAEWENYVLKGDSASPIDMADRLSYALYGMTTGVYTLGEAVFEDSVWETSYEKTFANTKSTPELWLSSALGTDMTGILYGTVTAARGYSYRFSEWEEIDLTVSNFDWLFRSGSGEDWDGTSAAKLRRENAHAWRGTKTGEDVNATVPMAEIRRQDELTAMDQWLLLQQKDGSLYLVMGYRSGAHPYRWIVRLNGGATELTRADLNGDGIEEVISYTGTSTQEPYRLRVSNQSGEELWSAELGLAHVGWSSYFLYRDSVKTALLCYEPTMYQGEASYSYELFMLSENGTTTLAENSVSFSVNPDSTDPWPAEAQKFADEVNRLLDQSELLFSTLNGELHCYGDDAVIRCTDPSESDGSRVLASADLDNDGEKCRRTGVRMVDHGVLP